MIMANAVRVLALGLVFVAATPTAHAADEVVILSSHRKTIQDEFVPRFKEWYQAKYKTSVDVQWSDSGGTSDAFRTLKSRFDKNPASADIDIFWGGGTSVFMELSRQHMLAPYTLPAALAKDIPAAAAGVPLVDSGKTWYASAMSSFGIFFNKKVLKLENLPEPKIWADLASPAYRDQITLADPRHSGTAMSINTILLQAYGWEKGWQILTGIDANTRTFTHSSSDPIKQVVNGDTAVTETIDFYATPQVAELGADNLGFVLPAGQTVLDPDPIALVKGAPHRQVAERFAEFVLSSAGQKLWILPKGAPDGPKLTALGRIAVNKATYAETEGHRTSPFNPFLQQSFMKLDAAEAARLERPLTDLLGATHIDTHAALAAAWAAVQKRGAKPAEVAELAKPPVTKEELLALSAKWDDAVLRNKTINAWVEAAKAKYSKLASR